MCCIFLLNSNKIFLAPSGVQKEMIQVRDTTIHLKFHKAKINVVFRIRVVIVNFIRLWMSGHYLSLTPIASINFNWNSNLCKYKYDLYIDPFLSKAICAHHTCFLPYPTPSLIHHLTFAIDYLIYLSYKYIKLHT